MGISKVNSIDSRQADAGIKNMSIISSLKRLRKRYQYWTERQFTGEYELKLLPQLTDRSKMSLDVGGNMGSYTYQLSRLSSSVVTFEPNPGYVKRIEMLGLRNVQVEQVALSDRLGSAQLRIPMSAGGYEDQGMASIEERAILKENLSRTLNVVTKSLDEYKFRNVGFIKIDVEGHEEAVLRGAAETLSLSKPAIIVEIEEKSNPGAIARITRYLRSIGYEGVFFEHGIKKDIDQFEINRHQSPSVIWDRKKYVRRTFPWVNNFIFTAPH